VEAVYHAAETECARVPSDRKGTAMIQRGSGLTVMSVQLTSCSRVLLEKLIVAQLVRKFPAFYGTRRFITVFTTARHWSLS